MKTALTILQVLVSLGLISTVLLQSGKSAGMSGAITGGAQTFLVRKRVWMNCLERFLLDWQLLLSC